jgi:ATP-dependent DNA helicase RecG
VKNENARIEFKREYTADIKKEVVAFANTSGGIIYVGIDDNGEIFEAENIDKVLSKITNIIRDSILPDITMFVNYEIVNKVIKIIVQEGTNKPYYLAEKGLKPSGVYVRQGSSSAPASFETIRQMIKLTDGDKYETARSIIQELTFNQAKEEFNKRNIEFGESQEKTLFIKGTDGLYTNLGLLLSDQCAHTIKIACFNGTEKGEFKSRKEFAGSVLKQLHNAYDFISLSNNLKATFKGLDRIESYDYPEDALREALLNAIIHRDYAFSGSIIVNIYDDRMEFISLGGLVPGISQNDILLGVSQPRNEKLANVFYRLKHIEAYGTGIKKIMNFYKEQSRKPVITVSDGAFVIEIPNMNYIKDTQNKTKKLKTQHEMILKYIKTNGSISKEQIQELLSVKQTRAYNVIKEMQNEGLIMQKEGSKEYVVK